MPQINLLLTDSSKKKKVKSLESRKEELSRASSAFLSISYVAIGILVFVWLVIAFLVFKDKRELSILEKRKNNLTASPQEISQINLKKEQLNERLALLSDLSSRKFLWAQKLERISEFIPDGIWLTEISLDRVTSPAADAKKEKTKSKDIAADKYIFVIKGRAFAYKIQDAVTLIGNFDNLLKEDKDFSQDFSEIKLSNVAKASISKTDFMSFEFDLFLH